MESVEPVENSQVKFCPFCAETIQAKAIKCRFCGEFLNTDEAKTLTSLEDSDSPPSEQSDSADSVLFKCSPSLWAMTGVIIRGMFFMALAVVLMNYPLEELFSRFSQSPDTQLSDSRFFEIAFYRKIFGLALAIIAVLVMAAKV
ncbi:MAG: hypothetical protein ACYSRZ_07715, partial [Planctomycetota bacterium]